MDRKSIQKTEGGQATWGQAIDTLTEAFTEDPCLAYLLDSQTYDPGKARHIHEYTLRVASLWGHTQVGGSGTQALSLWLPPRRVEVSTAMFIRAGGLGLRKTVDKGILKRLQVYGDYSADFHHRIAEGPHWYLLSIGVAKAHQGRGLARGLLDPMLAELDRQGLPCYLETHNPKNLGFYQKFGFQLKETGTLPGSTITHFALLRTPGYTKVDARP